MSLEIQKYFNLLTDLQPVANKHIYTLNLCYIQNQITKQLHVIIIDEINNKKYIIVQTLYGEQFTLQRNDNCYYSLLINVSNNYELDRLSNKFVNIDIADKVPRAVNIHDTSEIEESIRTVNFSNFTNDHMENCFLENCLEF